MSARGEGGFNGEALRAKTKAERYGWRLLGGRGTYLEIPKEQLVISEEYQRAGDETEQRAIAANFNWPAFGAILAAEREGKFFVFDGQQRLGAALRRPDITDPLPCMVFELGGSKEEAQAFLDVNVFRKVVTAMSKHHARLHGDDPTAILVESLVAEHGYRFHSNNHGDGRLKCVSLVTRWARNDPEILKAVFPLIAAIAGGGYIHELLVDGLLSAEKYLRKKGESLLTTSRRKRLIDLGPNKLVQGAKETAAFYSRGGGKVWATGVLREFNRGLQKKNRLFIGDPETGDEAE